MKKVITILGAIILTSIIFISCEQGKKPEKTDLTVNPKDSVSKIGAIIIPEPSQTIQIIEIGQQQWMAEDLNTFVYNNGDSINEAESEKQWKNYGSKKQGCYRKLANGTYVYNGFAVNDERGILPNGFILPTYDQFNQLIQFLGGGDSYSGNATKSMATYPIYIEDWVGDQETGGLETIEIKTNGISKFNAKKGGFVRDFGTIGEGNCSYWWTASCEGANIVVVDIGYCSQDLGSGKGTYSKSYGFSVRAIKK